MSRPVTQDQAADLIAVLTDASNLPVTGLVSADVTVEYRKEGGASFTAKSTSLATFVEIGSGVYTVEFTGTELDTLGSFLYKITGASISQYVGIAEVTPAAQSSSAVSLDTCVLYGHVLGASGEPVQNAVVSARILGAPFISGSIGIQDSRVFSKTDENGAFFIELVRLALVEIIISKMNYKRQLTVPNQPTANLLTVP